MLGSAIYNVLLRSASNHAGKPSAENNSRTELWWGLAKITITAVLTVVGMRCAGPIGGILTFSSLNLAFHRMDDLVVKNKGRPLVKSTAGNSSTATTTADVSALAQNICTNDGQKALLSLEQVPWSDFAKIRGVDAERLKATFESLYSKLETRELAVNGDGTWTDRRNGARYRPHV